MFMCDLTYQKYIFCVYFQKRITVKPIVSKKTKFKVKTFKKTLENNIYILVFLNKKQILTKIYLKKLQISSSGSL